MTPFEKLTFEEKKAIEQRIDGCAEAGFNSNLQHILREWNRQKTPIFHAFGDELILTKGVSFAKNEDFIENEINSRWDEMPSAARQFWRNFQSFVDDNLNRIYSDRRRLNITYDDKQLDLEDQFYRLNEVMSVTALAKNAVQREFSIDLPKPDGSTRRYFVQEGSKPMRVLRRLVEAFEFATMEELKEFIVWHSQFLNDRKIDGDLCLSIHPLDYMTMSDNVCDWTSCMSWDDNGCYRGGTVEMMNSPMVICAYLKSKKTFNLNMGWYEGERHTLNWNSKKWRILIIIDKSGIYSIKGYPYYHENLTKEVIDWVASLYPQTTYMPVTTMKPFRVQELPGKTDFEISPRTIRMYNDFGASTHWVRYSKEFLDNLPPKVNEGYVYTYSLRYSGASECMSCGALHNYGDSSIFSNEEYLSCSGCTGDYGEEQTCSICGDYCDEEEMYWVENDQVCPRCFERECFEDAWNYEYHYKEDSFFLLIADPFGKTYKIGRCHYSLIYDIVAKDQPYEKWANKIATHLECELTIPYSSLTKEAQDRFSTMIKISSPYECFPLVSEEKETEEEALKLSS